MRLERHLSRRAEAGTTLAALYEQRIEAAATKEERVHGLSGARRAAGQEARPARPRRRRRYKKALGHRSGEPARAARARRVLHRRGKLAGADSRLRERAAGAAARRARDGDVPADRHAVVEEARQPRERPTSIGRRCARPSRRTRRCSSSIASSTRERAGRSCCRCSGRRRRSRPTPSGAPSSASRWRSSPRSVGRRRRRRSTCGRASSSTIRRSAEAVAALKRLYQQTEKWNALLELLKERGRGARRRRTSTSASRGCSRWSRSIATS